MATPSPEADTHSTTLLVLCGGAGRRMNGEDKPLISWRGVPMVQRILDRAPAEMPKLISANRNLDTYRQWASVVTDEDPTPSHVAYRGPLAGILSGLKACETPWLMVCPGDTPELPANWCERLMQSVSPDMDGAVVHDGERQQHLHLLLKREVKTHLEAFLQEGGYQVYRWLQALQLTVVRIDNRLAFRNINSPADLL